MKASALFAILLGAATLLGGVDRYSEPVKPTLPPIHIPTTFAMQRIGPNAKGNNQEQVGAAETTNCLYVPGVLGLHQAGVGGITVN